MKAVNLIPGEQRAGENSLVGRSGGGALIVVGLVAGLIALALVYGHARRQISSQQGETASLKAQAASIEASTGRLTPYTSFVSMAEQRVQTVSQLIQSRFDWSHSLSELGRVLPSGTSLTSLHGTVGATGASSTTVATPSTGTAPASSTPPGSMPVFTLAGCATSQSEVALALQRLRLIDGASEVQLQSSTKSGVGGSASSGGGCPSGDPSFSAQITFTGLPAAQSTPPVTQASTATASAHSSGSVQPAANVKEAPR
jgi:Tfp pilus assembly protein PilN